MCGGGGACLALHFHCLYLYQETILVKRLTLQLSLNLKSNKNLTCFASIIFLHAIGLLKMEGFCLRLPYSKPVRESGQNGETVKDQL